MQTIVTTAEAHNAFPANKRAAYRDLSDEIVDIVRGDVGVRMIMFDGVRMECAVDYDSECYRISCDRDGDPRRIRYTINAVEFDTFGTKCDIDQEAIDFSEYDDITDNRKRYGKRITGKKA